MRCDFHTRFQQIEIVDAVTGKILNRRLDHGTGEAQQFYAALPAPARIGMEATGQTHWFERMLADQGNELWVGDEAQIRAGVVRKQKTYRLLLQQRTAQPLEHGRDSNYRQETVRKLAHQAG